MVYRRKVSAPFEVKMAMILSTTASIRMTRRTKRSITSHSRPQQISLPPPHWQRRRNRHLHLIQKKRNQSSSHPSFHFDELHRGSLSIMKTRPVSLSARLLLTVCSHQGGRFMQKLRVVALPRVVAPGSSVARASLPPTASAHTTMCLVSL